MAFELPKVGEESRRLVFWLAVYWLGYLMGWVNAYKVVWLGVGGAG